MNKMNLDALMVDRALGALSPDTEALLEAYLSQNPGMAMDMDRTTDTVDLCYKRSCCSSYWPALYQTPCAFC